ncbi:MAG: hypothetical protein JEZ11_01585 [Desulfobacterales bacterium]|nr:hypothetical protein [Desulfobacterales bacterium]
MLVAILLMALALVPMMDAFAPSLGAVDAQGRMLVMANQARGTLNRVTSLDFETLSANQGNAVDLATLLGSAEEAGKETVAFQGQTFTPIVDITDAGTGLGGLLEITVRLETAGFSTLKTDD